jgi:membrane fusion protein, heavy metal efflux system
MRAGAMLLALALALVAAGACKERPPETSPESSEHAEHGEHEHGDAGGATLVHIDPGMLRDLRITTAAVEDRPGGEGVTALGELGVNEDRYAEVSTPVAAQVTQVQAATGDAVKVGQALVELHSAEHGRAAASLASGEVRLGAMRKAVERKRQLAADGIVAPKDVQEAEAQLAEAEAEVASARAQLSAVGMSAAPSTAARFIRRSPVAGTIIDRAAVMGRVAEPGQPLFKVGDLSRIWLTVQGFERDAVRVRKGTEATVTLAAIPGRTFSARVALIGARVDPVSRTIPIRLVLDNPDGTLRPGMSASAFIPLGETGARIVTVPVAALQRLEDGWNVFLPSSEAGAFERRQVGRGRTLGGEVEILSGLKPGEKVVVEGAFLLKAEVEKAGGEGGHHEH